MNLTNERTRRIVAVALALWALPILEARAAKIRVAVLYFDNNTGKKAYDVLQKGFADMMITDLVNVKGIQVVEREKLQKLLAELKLQRTKYFNKRTALKIGKGLGAQYAVTGSFAAMEPQIRIDMRMIRIASSRIVLTSKVSGKKTDLFKLEQQLVKRFVARLNAKFLAPAAAKTRVPNVKTLVEYSRSIDLADRGMLTAAERRMAAVIRKAPTFTLAWIRRNDLIKRLRQSARTRRVMIGQSGKQLLQRAEAYLKRRKLAGLGKQDAKTFIAYRIVSSWFALSAVRQYLSQARGIKVILPGKKLQALRLFKAYYLARMQLIKDLQAYAKKHTRRFPNGLTYLDTSFRLPAADMQHATAAGFKTYLSSDLEQIRHGLARFLLLGYARGGAGKTFIVAPPLSILIPKYERIGYKLLKQVVAAAEAKRKRNPRLGYHMAIRALETHADALLMRGKRHAGAAKLQSILSRYPTSRQYKRIERRVKKQLGLVHDYRVKRLARYGKGLKTCGDMDLRVGIGVMLPFRLRTRGLRAIGDTIKEIEKKCRNNPKARRFFRYLYSHTALAAGRHGACKLFERLMGRFAQEGGSPRSVAAYRRNYTKCQAP